MGKKIGRSNLIFALTAFLALYLVAGSLTYSQNGYTLTKHSGIDSDAIICIEGQVKPTNQTLTFMPKNGVSSPWVRVNGRLHILNHTLSTNASLNIADFLVGCNEISFGSYDEGEFDIRISYLTHYRPEITHLVISNMRVGHNARYFIATKDWEKRTVKSSSMNITDISRGIERIVFHERFNGSATNYRMDEPGNYRATLQVYDGFVFSDIYEASFRSHLISTDQQVPALATKSLVDESQMGCERLLPSCIASGEHPVRVSVKRTLNGSYMLNKMLGWRIMRLWADIADGL